MIAVDTSALIWAVQSDRRSHADLARLEAIETMANGAILVPAPALAEYLQKLSGTQRAEAVRLLQKFATVVPFDYRAAIKCADLFKVQRGTKTRQAFKVDAIIIATAIAHGATHFLEADGDFAMLAENQPINLVNVTSLPVQPMLPLGPTPDTAQPQKGG